MVLCQFTLPVGFREILHENVHHLYQFRDWIDTRKAVFHTLNVSAQSSTFLKYFVNMTPKPDVDTADSFIHLFKTAARMLDISLETEISIFLIAIGLSKQKQMRQRRTDNSGFHLPIESRDVLYKTYRSLFYNPARKFAKHQSRPIRRPQAPSVHYIPLHHTAEECSTSKLYPQREQPSKPTTAPSAPTTTTTTTTAVTPSPFVTCLVCTHCNKTDHSAD